MYVYTGYSDSEDGFLILSNLDWADFARSRGFTYHWARGENVMLDFNSKYSVRDLEEQIDDGETCSGVFRVYRAECKMDENLASAVCW